MEKAHDLKEKEHEELTTIHCECGCYRQVWIGFENKIIKKQWFAKLQF